NRALDVHPTNLHQLQDAILSIWANISKECFQHLVESMPHRIKAVLKAKGGQTLMSEDLDHVVEDIQRIYPNSGYRMIHGHLQARGLRIQTSRVRCSLQRVDPEGSRIRALLAPMVRRRQYSVPCPNAMWHIDGNHKLIRYTNIQSLRFLPYNFSVWLFILVHQQTTSMAYLHVFAPIKVVNILLLQFMVANRGDGRNSHITGRSVHNQKIERLWRDVYDQVLDIFYHIFLNLEAEGLLNPDSDIDIFAPHWSFFNHLQRHLTFFMEAWNHHRLRTAGSQSPIQLWIGHREPAVHYEEGVVVPEVELPRELTADELESLPNPNAPFSDAVATYYNTVNQIKSTVYCNSSH
uniref:Integrase core domain-containing protein n=1 Tax=Paramormyrops kingsleyae TaxID=1676925 RepID=A0A3B3SM68_9TELE